MGMHGPLRDPSSVRGQRELPGFVHDKPDPPDPPTWLSADAKKVFTALVTDLIAAQVPVKKTDGHAIAMAAHCVSQTAFWVGKEKTAKKLEDKLKFSRQTARYQRDAQQWLAAICATPVSRARIGIRATDQQKKPAAGSVMSILKQKADRTTPSGAPAPFSPMSDPTPEPK